MTEPLPVAVVGGGAMGSAFARGMLDAGVCTAQTLTVCERGGDHARSLESQFGCHVITTIDQLHGSFSAVLLAVKPQDASALAALRPILQSTTLVASLMAGISIAGLKKILGAEVSVVRMMPNLPASIGKGVTTFFCDPPIPESQRMVARLIAASVGSAVELGDELAIDVSTAVSGSGPAYFFYFVEALEAAALKRGIPAGDAKKLAAATFIGAAHLLEAGDGDAEALRKRVTSKGGTTEAALAVLSSSAFTLIVDDAVRAATQRARELAGLV